jgi:hypothetical protein
MNVDMHPPILLLGNVRSGTTMVQNLIDLHPAVTVWVEARPVWNYADPGRKHDRFDETDATPKVINYIRKRFLRFQREHGNLQIMEKTPHNVVRIPYVRKIFPESKLIYLIREPLAQLSSSELKWRRAIDFRDKRWAMYRIRQVPKGQLVHYAARFMTEF